MDYEKEIPFGAFDSELMYQEIYIPEGFEATINGNRIILKKTESEDESIRKEIIEFVNINTLSIDERHDRWIAWLEKQGEQKPIDYEKATITQNDFASVGETATIELSSPIDCGDRIYHVSHKPIEKNGEQKQEWSEEDKQEVEEFLKSLQQRFQPSLLTIVDWLKSLKCRMKGKED